MNILESNIDKPINIEQPGHQSVPLVISSPHSGLDYPADFVKNSALSKQRLRSSEDCFVDEIFRYAPKVGAPLLKALFPRVFVDVNRGPFELDPTMFNSGLPNYVTTKNQRIFAGLGTVAKVVSNGEEVYKNKLDFDEIKKRIETCYHPYHIELKRLIDQTRDIFGFCILIDCHSMPSNAAKSASPKPLGKKGTDIILGDCHGSSCHPSIMNAALEILTQAGFSVKRNNPYAGGFITQHYGKPYESVHAIQIEINRSLYMNEKELKRLDGIKVLTRIMTDFMINMGQKADPMPHLKGAAE